MDRRNRVKYMRDNEKNMLRYPLNDVLSPRPGWCITAILLCRHLDFISSHVENVYCVAPARRGPVKVTMLPLQVCQTLGPLEVPMRQLMYAPETLTEISVLRDPKTTPGESWSVHCRTDP